MSLDHPDIVTSVARYESELAATLGSAVVDADVQEKHRKMRKTAFQFLRATCFRWAETAATLCPSLMTAAPVGAVVDSHAGNFGLWRDAQMRLVWGVNDFDEAARAPWPMDLVRLAASLVLALDDARAGEIADAVIAGYADGLATPRAFVLERDHAWLRDAFTASDKAREAYWAKLDAALPAPCNPAAFDQPLRAALGPVEQATIAPRSAGVGSLGRPRFVAMGQWRGGPVAAEIKALLPSAWVGGRVAGLADRLAHGRFRSPDPTLRYAADHVVRRLGPNSSKLDFDTLAPALHTNLFSAMGRELAAIHRDSSEAAPIASELAALPAGWLKRAAKTVAAATEADWDEFRRGAG
ncbi:DUF2252 family protein [Sphingomonas sp. TREG-RG-20F-R18-01]|uniref:DUF2252 family protein n=1 Tax=Sphingomonas sp. TREG-RG-20F-R18-01 TaxID=2914982 RepID=UPI001F590201|nr:DUF2252 family protein [Sphingomonas sp. TREG-RG-20F-R18-01]